MAKRSSRPRRESASAALSTLVYVHGICHHEAGYSAPWFASLRPHLSDAAGIQTAEVLWSDIVNPVPEAVGIRMDALAAAAESLLHPGPPAPGEDDLAENIRDILADRAQRQLMEAVNSSAAGPAGEAVEPLHGPLALTPGAAAPEAVFGIPGLDCVDDFTRYLLIPDIRRAILKRFHDVVDPLLDQGAKLAIISHSWGTVVAYEGLRQRDKRAADFTELPVTAWFTVGSALSIGSVKRRLLPEARDGRRPQLVRTWVNLNARFDIVGGALQGIPFQVDAEYLNLIPVGCSRILPNPSCAHSSYFHRENHDVNRAIFARHLQF